MKLRENKKIDSMLFHYFREEANNMEIPDQERCWQNLQKRLASNKQDQELPGAFIAPIGAEKKDSRFQFLKRYRNLTALAAACFLVFMLLSGMPPAQTLRQVLTGSLPQMGADSAPEMGVKGLAEDSQYLQGQKSMPLEAEVRDGAPAEEADADSFGIMQQDIPPGAGEMEELLPEVATADETRDLSFYTLEHYFTSLQEHRKFASGGIYYLSKAPEGYVFNRGIITKSDTSLLELRQEFTSPDGSSLIVQQSFYPDMHTRTEEPAEKEPYTEPDYHFFTINGSVAVQWIKDASTITLSGPFNEDHLLAIADLLVALE